jgi:hypothetical protein
MKGWVTPMTKLQREHRAKMRARRGIRPWDHKNEDDADMFVFRMRKMMSHPEMTDERIAKALSLDVPLVQVLRNKRHPQG